MTINSLYLDCVAVGITLKYEVLELLLKEAGGRRKKKRNRTLSVVHCHKVNQNL